MKCFKTIAALGMFAVIWLSFAAPARAQAPRCDSEASFGRSDKTLFGKYCGVCHTLSGNWNRIVKEPLAGLFERKQLVTGEPVNDGTVRKLIADGGPSLMPGFRYTMKPGEIDELVQYLKEAACPEKPAVSPKKN